MFQSQKASPIRVSSPDPDTYHGLTSLRFFAAFYVVLYHSLNPMVSGVEQHAFVQRAISLGYASVSFFFLLSGYILAVAYLKTGRDLRLRKRFYVARFARIYPLFALTLVLDTPDWFVAHARNFGGYLAALLPTTGVVFEHLLMLQAWFPSQRGMDRPNWSLSAEAFFYLLFPLIALRIWTLRSRAICLLALALWTGGQLLLLLADRYLSIDALMFVPLFHLSTFLLGITLARWQHLNKHRLNSLSNWSITLLLMIAGMATATFFIWPDLCAKQYLNDGLLAPIFAVMILVVSMDKRLPAKLLGNGVLRELGHASYALYLIHVPILHLAQHLHLPHTWTLYGVYLALCIALSLLSLNFIEIPLRGRVVSWSMGRETRLRSAHEPA